MSGRYDNSTVTKVQQANDIVEVISEHVSLVKKGKEMAGLCPFHEDHRPSMYVNEVKQIFKCFACSAGGDVFKFVQMRENLTFPQAIERLAERVGIELKQVRSARGQKKQEHADVDPNRLAKANVWAAEHFEQNLRDKQKGESTRNYISERQITPESVKKWKLGLAIDRKDDLVGAANSQKASTAFLEKAGLILSSNSGSGYYDKFVNRLMFSITDVTGRVIGFGGRTLGNANAKYMNSPTTVLFDKSNCLYGLEHARHEIVSSGVAVVVEGYTDCIMAHQFGCKNVVATLGTSLTSGHARMLRRYAKKIVLIFDGDTAGIEATNRALEICLAQHIDIKLASVPEGKDPCDFLLSEGKDKFKELVATAVDVFKFKWNRLTESFSDENTIVDNKAAIEEFLQTIATGLLAGNLDTIEKGLIVNRLSKIIGIDSKEINSEISKRISRAARSASYSDTTKMREQKATSVDLGEGVFAVAQREILEVLLNEPELSRLLEGKVGIEVFDVPILKQIATILFEALKTNTGAGLTAILAATDSVETSSVIVGLAETGEEKGNFKSRLVGAIDAIGRLKGQKAGGKIETIDDPNQLLRRFSENNGNQNPHSIGMV